MEAKILSKEKKELKIEILGDKHTVTNLLRAKLVDEGDVDVAGYDKVHPLENKAIFVLKTKSKDASTVLKKAINDIEKELDSASKELARIK